MGWGPRKAPAVAATVPAPQPAKTLERSYARLPPAKQLDEQGDVVEIVDESAARPAASVKGQLEWHQLRAKRGWTNETTSTLFYEFIQSREMFAELVTFARKRR